MLRPERDGYLTVMGVAAGHSVACRKYSSQSVCPLNLAIQCLLRNGRLCHKPQQGRSSTEDGQNQGSQSESRRAVPQGRKANRLSDDHRKGTRSWAKSLGSYSAEATQNQTIVGAVGASDWQLLERVAITLQIIR